MFTICALLSYFKKTKNLEFCNLDVSLNLCLKMTTSILHWGRPTIYSEIMQSIINRTTKLNTQACHRRRADKFAAAAPTIKNRRRRPLPARPAHRSTSAVQSTSSINRLTFFIVSNATAHKMRSTNYFPSKGAAPIIAALPATAWTITLTASQYICNEPPPPYALLLVLLVWMIRHTTTTINTTQ